MKGLKWARDNETARDKNRKKVLELMFQRKSIQVSIRQLMIPAFDPDKCEAIWFDSKHKNGQNIKVVD